MEDKILLTTFECATRLSIGRSKLYQLMAAGELRPVRIGRAVRLHRQEVEAYARRLLDEATDDDGRED